MTLLVAGLRYLGRIRVMYRKRELVDTLDDISPKAEAQRHWDIFGALKAKALAVTLAEGRSETLDKTNYYTV